MTLLMSGEALWISKWRGRGGGGAGGQYSGKKKHACVLWPSEAVHRGVETRGLHQLTPVQSTV